MSNKTAELGDKTPAVLRLAIVGFGLVGQRHAEAIKKAHNVGLSAVVDTAEEAMARAKALGLPCYESLASLIVGERPDGIIHVNTNNTPRRTRPDLY